ncbi:MAG: glycosyltransferase family 4 protein [Sphingobium sp.]|nr:glycosyltransferase family 4 protein [Sphingobium sp.]
MEPVAQSCLIDVSRLIWRAWEGRFPTGIDRTCLAYVNHYGDAGRAVVQRGGRTWVLDRRTSQRLFGILKRQGTGVKQALLTLLPAAFASSIWPENLVGVPYLNVGHTGLDRLGHAAWIQKTGVLPIYFVHDLIPLTHPEYCRPGEAEKHLRRMTALLAHGAGVIGNSRQTLRELALFAESRLKLDLPPDVVAPLGVGKVAWELDRTSRLPTPVRPYFVILGTIEGRKNHLLILNIWADLARRLGPECPQLVIVGKRGWESEQAVDMLERCEAIRGHIIEAPRCEDARLAAYIAHARALLFPSFVEGYGLPLVEALSLGTPVIASDLTVFRELAGEIPDYLSPLDGLGWTRLIEDYSNPESAARAAQLSRMEGWKTPRWRDHFARVDQWLAQFGVTSRQTQMPNG